MERAEIIITTGGLGPTVDDPTREAVAKAVGVETEFREELWEQVVATISKYGRKPADNQKRQAVVPKGAARRTQSRWHGASLYRGSERNAIISLPGVPNEMEHILPRVDRSYLQNDSTCMKSSKSACFTPRSRRGTVDEKDRLTLKPSPIQQLALRRIRRGRHSDRVEGKKRNRSESNDRRYRKQIRERLGNVVFGVDEDRLEEVVLNLVAKTRLDFDCNRIRLGWLIGAQTSSRRFLPELTAASLMDALRTARADSKADVALGVTNSPGRSFSGHGSH